MLSLNSLFLGKSLGIGKLHWHNSNISGKQETITGAATTIASSNLTASRALISNSSGKVAVSAITSTELGYLDGVTSNIQTQITYNAVKKKQVTSTSPTWILLNMLYQSVLACYCVSHNNYNVIVRYNKDSTNFIATIMNGNTAVTATDNYIIDVYYINFKE